MLRVPGRKAKSSSNNISASRLVAERYEATNTGVIPAAPGMVLLLSKKDYP